ncbi:MAG: hypothetical protein OER88_02555 [Planctomycetota bacterium]|nr:hypothetical protein [Planctomycetota bacterium]
MASLILLTCLLAPEGAHDAILNHDTLDVWRQFLTPAAGETVADAIAWVPSLHEGLIAADARQRPLFLWVMNGHPLGCT